MGRIDHLIIPFFLPFPGFSVFPLPFTTPSASPASVYFPSLRLLGSSSSLIFCSTRSLLAGTMSIIQPTRSRPLAPLPLEDGPHSGSSSIPSGGFGQSPESAMVEEIFNNPDVWSVQFGEPNSADVVNLSAKVPHSGRISLDDGTSRRERTTVRDHPSSGASPKIHKKRSKSARVPEGYHLKRRSKLQVEAFTLKPFESRHRIMPYLSSASSVSDSSSIASSTPSLNSSLPTISDEDSIRSKLNSVPTAPVKWRGMQDIEEGPNESLSLVALMESSNNISPRAAERMSILWSHQNIFRAFPTPKGIDSYDSHEGSLGSQSSAKSTGSTMEAVTGAFPLTDLGDSSQTGVMKPRRNVPPLTISTTTTRMTTTTTTTVITVQSPARSSPASMTVISASATWSILELYGDSPKPSPKIPKLPKTSGHLDRSFKASDLQLPGRPPKTAFATNFPSQRSLHTESTSGLVELPADFVIPELPRLKPKLKGPRLSPPSQMRITMVKDLDLPSALGKEVSKDRKNGGAVRPLPQVPQREQSTPSSVPPLPSQTTTVPPPQKSSHPGLQPAKKASPVVSHTGVAHTKKSALRSKMIPPPPLYLDSPLPPLPSDAVQLPKMTREAKATSNTESTRPLISLHKPKAGEVAAVKDVNVKPKKLEKKPPAVVSVTQRNQNLAVPQLTLSLQPANPVTDSLAPARPSRRDVISPLPSPLLDRLHALESLPGKKFSSPPVSAHRPSASESSPRSAGHLSLSPPPAKSLTKKGLRKSASISSMPRLTPEFPLPDASVLAQRFKKNSATGVTRPTLAPNVQVVVSPPQKPSKMRLELNSKDAGVSSFTELAASSIPAASETKVDDGIVQKVDIARGSSDGLLPNSRDAVKKVEFPLLDLSHEVAAPSQNLSRPQPLFTHRKGVSLHSIDTRPVFKTHKKSSSAVAFKIPAAEHPFPDAATLAKRLAARKESNASGSKPTSTSEHIPKKDLISGTNRPNPLSSASDHKQHTSETVMENTAKLSSEATIGEIRIQAPTIPRPSHTKNASTSVLHQKPAHSLKKMLSHTSLGVSSPALHSATRSQNGSTFIRGANIRDVPLPDASVLAQRKKVSSSSSSRSYGDVSDAFTPSTMSAVVPSPALVKVRLGGGARVPLAAPEPVVASASSVSQLTQQMSEVSSHPMQVENVVKVPLSHSRSRSVSGARAPKASSPPKPSMPIHTLARESPALQVPKGESNRRTPSPGPGILVRNRAASPGPTSALHVRFLPVQKDSGVPFNAPPVDELTERGRMLNHGGESSRGRQLSNIEVVSPRGRSASLVSPSKEFGKNQRSTSATAFSRNHPLPPIPLSAEGYSSDDPVSAGSSRGRISPFPSRPVSRASTLTGV
ncbi:hypothetical protein EV361DRAFT_255013 [Lentinula raphanica]|nr:hypothetical protein EV361DRAFT_255013 [Lentinula raphanica]